MSPHGLKEENSMSKLESVFQGELIKEIEDLFPGAIILKNDPNYIQGFPDLSVYYEDKYAILEVKKAKDAPHQPNQDYYIDYFSRRTFAAFIYPENKEEVLDGLQSAFRSGRKARIS